MNPQNNKLEIEERTNGFKKLNSLFKSSSSQQNIADNQSNIDNINKPSSLLNNTTRNNNITPIAQSMKSLGYPILIHNDNSQSLNNKPVDEKAKQGDHSKPTIAQDFLQRNEQLSQRKLKRCIQGRNGNPNEIKQPILALSSIELANKMKNRPSLYPKQPKASDKTLKTFLVQHSVERNYLIRKSQSGSLVPICYSKKVRRKERKYSPPSDEDSNNLKVSMNKLSMIMSRVQEYTRLQLGLSSIKADLLVNPITKTNTQTKTKTKNDSIKAIDERSRSLKEAKHSLNSNNHCVSSTKKDALALRVHSTPKSKSKRKTSKEKLHWSHTIINPNLNSNSNKPTKRDCLYKININDNSSWKKHVENIIQAKSKADREIIQYYIE